MFVNHAFVHAVWYTHALTGITNGLEGTFHAWQRTPQMNPYLIKFITYLSHKTSLNTAELNQVLRSRSGSSSWTWEKQISANRSQQIRSSTERSSFLPVFFGSLLLHVLRSHLHKFFDNGIKQPPRFVVGQCSSILCGFQCRPATQHLQVIIRSRRAENYTNGLYFSDDKSTFCSLGQILNIIKTIC